MTYEYAFILNHHKLCVF